VIRRTPRTIRPRALADDPLWFKDAVIYEVRVRSFSDSNDDGIGDLRGLTSRLDYLQDLGVTALWLLPFYPSPMRDDGYDISDYTDVDPDVGTLDDFKELLAAAHRRGLRIITELVLNHSSDQHPWFQRSRTAPRGSPERELYVWSDTDTTYREARIIFKDFESSNWTWDGVANQYFWHRFYSHQPDLNYNNPTVHELVLGIVDFWLGLGVDGLRLDAVPYLYEREGTTCENLPETHGFLRKLRQHIDEKWKNRMLLAEANQWPEDAAAYFGEGDECHMNFNFPIMPRLFMAIHMEDRFPIVDILAQTPTIPGTCQWAMFLRNHDELTLEMVTDEERDYMYRAYAHDPTMRINLGIRRRLAPLVDDDRRKMELMNALLCSLPGTPVLYYGDEIGMGDNIYLGDRNGVRTPMQWSPDRNAGFSRSNPQRLVLPVVIDPEYHYEAVNVEAQQQNESSLLWWTKRLLALRDQFHAFGRGTIEVLSPENPRVLAFLRRYQDELVMVVANLSRHVQYVELDLSALRGMTPVELFGRTPFPPVGELPYLLTLGEHAFMWFSLELTPSVAEELREASWLPPTILVAPDVGGGWPGILTPSARAAIEQILPEYLLGRRWFAGKDRPIRAVRLVDAIPLPVPHDDDPDLELAIVQVDYAGESERYALPVAFSLADARHAPPSPASRIAQVKFKDDGPVYAGLYDALAENVAPRALAAAIARGETLRGSLGEVSTVHAPEVAFPVDPAMMEARVVRAEVATSVSVLGSTFFLKTQRLLDEGSSVELELGRFLALAPSSPTPKLYGGLELRAGRGEPMTIAVLSQLVASSQDAAGFVREELRRFFARALAGLGHEPVIPSGSVVELAARTPPPEDREAIGGFLDAARLLGSRVAELHLALSGQGVDMSAVDDRVLRAFTPEPHSPLDQRAAYQSVRNVTGKVLHALRVRQKALPEEVAGLARAVLSREDTIYELCLALRDGKLTDLRQRTHGALELRHVLYTGKDFVIVDLEGDRRKTLAERRRKRSVMRDLASLLHSMHQAAYDATLDGAVVREADRTASQAWAELWTRWSTAALTAGWLARAGDASCVPKSKEELGAVLDVFLLQHAFVDVGDALAAPVVRTVDAAPPLRAILRVIG
jgi:maltose alpha-D-glucosyltransferase/alpha-amylase